LDLALHTKTLNKAAILFFGQQRADVDDLCQKEKQQGNEKSGPAVSQFPGCDSFSRSPIAMAYTKAMLPMINASMANPRKKAGLRVVLPA
jgi:hypothetical protein